MSSDVPDQIRLYLRARVTLIAVVTAEEERAITILRNVSKSRGDLITWDFADGFSVEDMTEADPATALDKIRDRAIKDPNRRDLYVLKDPQFWSKDPRVRRKLRNLAQRLICTGSSLIVTTPARNVPDELKDETVIIEVPLPDEDSLRTELHSLISTNEGIKNKLTQYGEARLAQAALGLTTAQARRAFAKAIIRDKVLDDRDIDAVVAEKKAVIRESQALEFYTVGETPDDVGGLEALKNWLTLRERAFGGEAADYGLPAPKGLALIGIPGTGKSLTAKMIAGLWRLPLLRLDGGCAVRLAGGGAARERPDAGAIQRVCGLPAGPPARR